jgi:arylsulfatase A-like enzyme
MLPVLLNKKQPKHDYLYWEFHESGGKQAVRWKNWKAVKLNVSLGMGVVTELYDITRDPAEKNNLAGQNKKILTKMEAFMKEAHQKNNDWILFPSEK